MNMFYERIKKELEGLLLITIITFCGDDSVSNREEERRYFGLSVRCLKDK